MAVITIAGVAGNKDDAVIGTSLALSASDWTGVASATWEITRPPTSAAALTTVGLIGAPPFTNALVPDVPGNYRIRLIVTTTTGAVVVDTALVRIEMPFALVADEALPAPLEEDEENGTTGWADEVNRGLQAAYQVYSGNEWVTVVNNTGGDLAAFDLVALNSVQFWPLEMGGSIVVAGVNDAIYRAETPTAAAGENLALVVNAIADGAKGRVLRRGVVPMSTGAWSAGAILGGLTALAPLSRTRSSAGAFTTAGYPLGKVAIAGLVWFDPGAGELRQAEEYVITLADGATDSIVDDDGATLPRWDITDFSAVICAYEVTRSNRDVEVGHLYLTFGTTGGVTTNPSATAVGGASGSPGVTFGVSGVFNAMYLKYTSTSTGATPVLRLRVLQEFRL